MDTDGENEEEGGDEVGTGGLIEIQERLRREKLGKSIGMQVR